MKKIEFGFANEKDPKGSWQGIGINPNLMLLEAQYFGAVCYGNEYLIVAKVTKDKYSKHPQLLNKFIVREALVDLYKDGSGILFLNQEESLPARQLEAILNDQRYIDRFHNLEDVKRFLPVSSATKAFDMISSDSKIISTSITPEAFNDKKDAIYRCRGSFSDLQKQLDRYSNSFRR